LAGIVPLSLPATPDVSAKRGEPGNSPSSAG